MNSFYIYDGRNETGPFTIDDLKQQKLSRSTPIRLHGSNNWMPAEKISDLKELVAPRKIQRAKDIVPVIRERAAEFKERRPKMAYAILFCIAMLAGISIYSIGKGIGKGHSESISSSSTTPINLSKPTAGVTEKQVALGTATPKEDKEKAARLKWNKLFTAVNSNYGIGLLGGIKDLKVIVTNSSDYPIDEAVIKLTYIKVNGDVWKTKQITVYGVAAHDTKQQPVPDVNRGKKVNITLHKIVSKKMKFSYVAGKKIRNPEDPYVIQ